MKLVTLIHNGHRQIGAVVGDSVAIATGHIAHADNMLDFLACGQTGMAAMRDLIASGRHRINLPEVQLLAPVPRPGKFLGIGLNYADHISETGREKPEYPTFFTKQSSCVIGHGAAIHCPEHPDLRMLARGHRAARHDARVEINTRSCPRHGGVAR